MQVKKILSFTLLLCSITSVIAITPSDPKYCSILTQIKDGMDIGDVFLLMGPPHSFGQPPNVDMNSLRANKANMQPQNTINQNDPATRARVLKSIAADPILGAFMNAPTDSENVLIWNFEGDSLSVSVKVKGPTVTDVKANFTCSN